MERERKLPIVDIAGLAFYADATRGEFIDTQNPENTLHIMEMLNFNDHSEFAFDLKQRNIYDGPYYDIPPDINITYVWVRPIGALDPEGMRIMIQKGQLHWEEHYLTPLPTVTIGEDNFYVDPIRKGFREVANPWNILHFSEVSHFVSGITYYDKQVRNVPFPYELDKYNPPASLPEHIIPVQLPTGKELTVLLKDVVTVQHKSLIEHREENVKTSRNNNRIRRNG